MKPQHQRWQLFVDRPIQGALLIRAAVYWAVCLLTQQLIVFLFVVATSWSDDFQTNGSRLLWHVQVSTVASLAILPIILLDVLKLSHRWVGPVFRLRATLKSLTLGEPVPPIRFRERDFWQDLARDMNVITAELNRLRADQPNDNLPTEELPPIEESEFLDASQRGAGRGPAVFAPFPGHSGAAAAPSSTPITVG
jgi:hypothetical protein